MRRNKFSLSHRKLFSCDLGQLIPFGLVEVLPGDTFQHATSCLVRCSPLLAPVMHPVHAAIHHWFVPHRLIWSDWENFITGGADGMNASVFPTIAAPPSVGFAIGSLADYLGVPTGVADIPVSALPFRGYALIWNQFYRDQDLDTALVVDVTDGVDTTTNTTLQRGRWEKDYFTSSRPWEQKGPSITIPLGTSAPVVSTGTRIDVSDENNTVQNAEVQFATSTATRLTTSPSLTNAQFTKFGSSFDALETDLSSASAVTVNILREALALQRFEEARARYGSRYVEYLRYLGVRSSDARLQRPEFLGGGRQTIQFSEVLQTAEGTNPVGELRGHGIGAMRSNRYRRYFEEHGYVFSLLVVRPKTVYVQGLQRTWNRRTKEDFYQKELETIGQQEVLNKEVYAAHASPDDIFGYQDRYDEYRRMESYVSGEFRDTLDFWHFGRQFASDPALNSTFVSCVPTEEPFAVPSANTLYVMASHSIQARRLLQRTGRSLTF